MSKSEVLFLYTLLSEYVEQLKAGLDVANKAHTPSQIRAWNNLTFNMKFVSEDADPKTWHWKDDPLFIHESLSPMVTTLNKLDEFLSKLHNLLPHVI